LSVNRRFGGPYRLHLQQEKNQQASRRIAEFWSLAENISSTLKMEALCSSETSVDDGLHGVISQKMILFDSHSAKCSILLIYHPELMRHLRPNYQGTPPTSISYNTDRKENDAFQQYPIVAWVFVATGMYVSSRCLATMRGDAQTDSKVISKASLFLASFLILKKIKEGL
jgi:hypothetical protein